MKPQFQNFTAIEQINEWSESVFSSRPELGLEGPFYWHSQENAAFVESLTADKRELVMLHYQFNCYLLAVRTLLDFQQVPTLKQAELILSGLRLFFAERDKLDRDYLLTTDFDGEYGMFCSSPWNELARTPEEALMYIAAFNLETDERTYDAELLFRWSEGLDNEVADYQARVQQFKRLAQTFGHYGYSDLMNYFAEDEEFVNALIGLQV